MRRFTILLVLLVTGCSVQPTINAAFTAGVNAAKQAEDANISAWTVNACGTPFSAAIRHPEIVPALRVLCLPQGDMANPANLLNAIKPE